MRGCRRGADSATAGRCEGADSAAADQRGGVVHLQAQRVHARLPPAAAEADLATAGCHSLLGNARRRRVFNDGSRGRGMAAWGAARLLVDLVQNWAILGSCVGEEGDGDSTILGPEERRLTICYVSFSLNTYKGIYYLYIKNYSK